MSGHTLRSSSHRGNVAIDLLARQLPALAGLRTLRDLDLDLRGSRQYGAVTPNRTRRHLSDLRLRDVASHDRFTAKMLPGRVAILSARRGRSSPCPHRPLHCWTAPNRFMAMASDSWVSLDRAPSDMPPVTKPFRDLSQRDIGVGRRVRPLELQQIPQTERRRLRELLHEVVVLVLALDDRLRARTRGVISRLWDYSRVPRHRDPSARR